MAAFDSIVSNVDPEGPLGYVIRSEPGFEWPLRL